MLYILSYRFELNKTKKKKKKSYLAISLSYTKLGKKKKKKKNILPYVIKEKYLWSLGIVSMELILHELKTDLESRKITCIFFFPFGILEIHV